MVHSKLCLKLTSFGFQGELLHCIADFLHGRTQSVRVGTYYSDPCDVISRVPQGSVLGPLVFLLFINDTVTIFSRDITVKLFADDIKIYMVVNNIE